MAAVHNRIKVLRAEFGMTQEDLAQKTGVTRQTIFAVEHNKYVPSLELAFKIAEVFGRPIGDVFSYT
jgi:putative transcriptional regulator